MSVNECVYHKEMQQTQADHEDRIRALETNTTQMLVRLDNLCIQIAELNATIKKVAYSAVGIGIAFIIWYIQIL